MAPWSANATAAAIRQVAEAIPPGPGERDPDELLVASFRSFLEAVAQDPLTWRLFLLPIEGMPAAVARRAEKTRAALRGQVTQLVAWGVEQRGGPAGLDNELMAHFLLSTGEDAGRLRLTFRYRARSWTVVVEADGTLSEAPALGR